MSKSTWTIRAFTAFSLALPAAAISQIGTTRDQDLAMVKMLEGAVAARPDPSLQFLLMEAHARLGNRTASLGALRMIVDGGRSYFPPRHAAIWRFASDPDFAFLFGQLAQRLPRSSNGSVHASVGDGTIISEGIAYDSQTKSVFIGDLSTRSILQLSQNGELNTLVANLPMQPFGMAVDAHRRRLWIATNDSLLQPPGAKAELLRFELDSGNVQTFTADGMRALNDVAVAPNGDAYVSDSAGMIWTVSNGSKDPVRLTQPGELTFPNGLAVSGSGRRLFVAQGSSIVGIDLETRAVTPLQRPQTLETIGTDGLYWKDGHLFGIQNLLTPGRIVRMQLSPDEQAITGFSNIDIANPAFDLPTTAAFIGDRLIVLANSRLYRMAAPTVVATEEPLTLLSYPAQ